MTLFPYEFNTVRIFLLVLPSILILSSAQRFVNQPQIAFLQYTSIHWPSGNRTIYHVTKPRLEFHQALIACATNKLRLVEIKLVEKATFLYKLWKRSGLPGNEHNDDSDTAFSWIGAGNWSKGTEGNRDFHWIDSDRTKPNYTLPARGTKWFWEQSMPSEQPGNAEGAEWCIAVKQNPNEKMLKAHDHNCFRRFNFYCETPSWSMYGNRDGEYIYTPADPQE